MAEKRSKLKKAEKQKTDRPKTGLFGRGGSKKTPASGSRTRSRYSAGKKARFRGIYAFVSCFIMAAAVLAACLVFFRVDSFTVSGSERYTDEEIIDASFIEEGDNLFLMNKFEIQKDMLRRLPYLQEVHITRGLPSTINIAVTECKAVAGIQVSNGFWLIDSDGKLLELADSQGDLPKVTGISLLGPTAGSSAAVDSAYKVRLSSLIELLQALESQDLLADAQSIDLSDGSQVVMQYASRYTVKIPYGSDFDYKMRAMDGIIDQLVNGGDMNSGVIDLTMDDEWHFIPS